MDTQLAANIINSVIAGATLAAVIVAFIAINKNRDQARDDWGHTQELALKERQYQGRPIIAPKKEITHNIATYFSTETEKSSEDLYTSEHRINWSWPHAIRLNMYNMGS